LTSVRRKLQSSTAFIKAIQIKRDESDFQSLTKILYHQKPFQKFLRILEIFKKFLVSQKLKIWEMGNLCICNWMEKMQHQGPHTTFEYSLHAKNLIAGLVAFLWRRNAINIKLNWNFVITVLYSPSAFEMRNMHFANWRGHLHILSYGATVIA